MIESRLVSALQFDLWQLIHVYGLSEVREDGMFGPVLGPHGCQNDLVLCTAIQLKTIVYCLLNKI